LERLKEEEDDDEKGVSFKIEATIYETKREEKYKN